MFTFLDNNWLLVLAILWTLPWKGVALWKAARKNDKNWFLALLVLNTFALLEAAYIFHFSERVKGRKKNKVQKNDSEDDDALKPPVS